MGAFTAERDIELVLWFARRKKEKAKAAAEEIEAERFATSEDELNKSAENAVGCSSQYKNTFV